MTTLEIIIAALAAPAAYGAVKAFAVVDSKIERIKKHAFKLAEVCREVGLELLCEFFEAIAVRDIAGAISAAKSIRKMLAPEKLWGTLRVMFFKQLAHRLEKIPEDAAEIYKAVDKQRMIDKAAHELEVKSKAAEVATAA